MTDLSKEKLYDLIEELAVQVEYLHGNLPKANRNFTRPSTVTILTKAYGALGFARPRDRADAGLKGVL